MRKWLTPNLGLASFTCKEKPAHHNMGVADTGQEHNAGGGGQRGGVAGRVSYTEVTLIPMPFHYQDLVVIKK